MYSREEDRIAGQDTAPAITPDANTLLRTAILQILVFCQVQFATMLKHRAVKFGGWHPLMQVLDNLCVKHSLADVQVRFRFADLFEPMLFSCDRQQVENLV